MSTDWETFLKRIDDLKNNMHIRADVDNIDVSLFALVNIVKDLSKHVKILENKLLKELKGN